MPNIDDYETYFDFKAGHYVTVCTDDTTVYGCGITEDESLDDYDECCKDLREVYEA